MRRENGVIVDEFDADELMGWVAGQVSPQKRIRLVETVEEIPKSPSGKILRRNLRDPYWVGKDRQVN